MIIEINGSKNYKKITKLNLISLKENENKFNFTDLTLNKKFKIIDLKSVKADYIDQENIRNQFEIKTKNNIYYLEGATLNINKIVDNLLYNDEKTNIINKNFKLDINIDKLFLDKESSLKKLR